MTASHTALDFERETCSRCGGSGEYSWNPKDGSRCFKCLGTGQMYTRRGVAAKRYFEDSLSLRGDELEPGMLVRKIKSGDVRVSGTKIRIVSVAIEDTPNGQRRILTGKGQQHSDMMDATYYRIPTRELREVKMAEALAFQATLTKAGTPRK